MTTATDEMYTLLGVINAADEEHGDSIVYQTYVDDLVTSGDVTWDGLEYGYNGEAYDCAYDLVNDNEDLHEGFVPMLVEYIDEYGWGDDDDDA